MKNYKFLSVIMVLVLCFGVVQSVDAKKKKTRKYTPKTENRQSSPSPQESVAPVNENNQSSADVLETIMTPIEEAKLEPKPKKEEIFKTVAHMPLFPGGDAALMKCISERIRYPQTAQDNGIQGLVVVQFVVEKDGRVGEVKVARGVDKDLDREAVRVCKMLPKFTPGRNSEGEPVRVWYTLPIKFGLQGSN